MFDIITAVFFHYSEYLLNLRSTCDQVRNFWGNWQQTLMEDTSVASSMKRWASVFFLLAWKWTTWVHVSQIVSCPTSVQLWSLLHVVKNRLSLQDVMLAADVSANHRYVRGRHVYQTFHLTLKMFISWVSRRGGGGGGGGVLWRRFHLRSWWPNQTRASAQSCDQREK